MTALWWTALGIALGAALVALWTWRRTRRERTQIAAERDHAVRALDSLRGILQEYIEQREDVEETLRESEGRLRRSEERLRTLVDHAAYGIYRCGQDSRFIDANPAMVRMLGYDLLEELQQLAVLEEIFVEPADRARWQGDLASGRLRDWYDFTWRRRDATTIRVRVSPRLVRGDQGQVLYCDAIAENVTERLHREEMVRRGERMAALGRTLAGVAHEINNPLAAIAGFAQLLLKGPLAEDERHALSTMLHEAQRAARIVKDLLAVARRQESHEPRPVDVNAVVSYIVDTQRYALDTHGIRCITELASAPAIVRGDPAQLEQVVLNLVVNARQALEHMIERSAPTRELRAPPTIRVLTAIQGDVVSIEVSDNGPGIAAADLPRIFDPFFTTKDEGKGSGLGLAVVHGIVTQHGGGIDVTSTLGSGSHFRVSLPRDTLTSEVDIATTPTTLPAVEPDSTRLDILVVDDEGAIRALLERAFTSRGHAVMQASDGTQALNLAAQMPFDVVICDLRMPGLSGRDVVSRMRELPTCEHARFILSTGDSTTTEQLQSDEGLAVAAVVSKPYDLDGLRRLVEQR
ncbi:MAG TPA: ATP-binding protein [Gemmatimonadaceae bacterium]|nr:ATP-binding protein [Gemmatimonadaceae bacterium]